MASLYFAHWYKDLSSLQEVIFLEWKIYELLYLWSISKIVQNIQVNYIYVPFLDLASCMPLLELLLKTVRGNTWEAVRHFQKVWDFFSFTLKHESSLNPLLMKFISWQFQLANYLNIVWVWVWDGYSMISYFTRTS